jgi:hypothetical protein
MNVYFFGTDCNRRYASLICFGSTGVLPSSGSSNSPPTSPGAFRFFFVASPPPIVFVLCKSSAALTLSASSVSVCTISNVRKPRISTMSSFGLLSVTTPNPAHSRNRFPLRNVKLACRQSDQKTYSSLVMFRVRSSADARRASVASFCSSSSSLSSSSSRSGTVSEKKDWTSQGRMSLAFLLAAPAGFLESLGPAPWRFPPWWRTAYVRNGLCRIDGRI